MSLSITRCLSIAILIFIVVPTAFCQNNSSTPCFTLKEVRDKALEFETDIPPVFVYSIGCSGTGKSSFLIHNTNPQLIFNIYLDDKPPLELKAGQFKSYNLSEITEKSIMRVELVESSFQTAMNHYKKILKNKVRIADSLDQRAAQRSNAISAESLLGNIVNREREIPKAGDKKLVTEYEDGLVVDQYYEPVTLNEELNAKIASYSFDLLATMGYLATKKLQAEKNGGLTTAEQLELMGLEAEREAIEILEASKGKVTPFSYLFKPISIYNFIIAPIYGYTILYSDPDR